MRVRKVAIGAVSMLALGASVAEAQPTTTPAKTVQLPRAPGLECSVSAFGPSFEFVNRFIIMTYAGGTSCAGGRGVKTLRTWVEVQTPPPRHFIRITGTLRQINGVTANPVRISVRRQAFLGHGYRVVSQSTVQLNGVAVSATVAGNALAP